YLLNNQINKALENYQKALQVLSTKKARLLYFLAKHWPFLAKILIKIKRKSSFNPKERIHG
ncbi:unnamed protein product, partial [marine sediment metagenome]